MNLNLNLSSSILNSVKSALALLWIIPFLYMFMDIYFDIDLQISPNVFIALLIVSFLSAGLLVIIWLKELLEFINLSNVFKYLRAFDLQRLDKILSRSTNPSQYQDNGKNLLEVAVDEQHQYTTIHYLLSKNCFAIESGNYTYDISYTLFYLCSYYKYFDVELLNLLLSKRADINFVDTSLGVNGLSVLQVAVLAGHKDVIHTLLEQGANVNYKVDELALNTLMLAVKYTEDPTIIKLLIEYGAKVNEINEDGYSALLIAAQYNSSPTIISLLINSGARFKIFHIYDADGRYVQVSALMVACQYNNYEVIKKLITLGDDVVFNDNLGINALFIAAAHNSDVNVIKLLLQNGLELDKSVDKEGNTPLLFAAFFNSSINVIQYLIEKSYNILTIANKDGFIFVDYLKQNPNLSQQEIDIILKRYY